MPVRAVYEMKDTPLPIAVDMYKIIVDSIEEEFQAAYEEMIKPLTYDFRASDTEEKCVFEEWSEAMNDLYFTKGYTSLFEEPIYALWIAYEALTLIFELKPDGKTGDVQVFYYKRKKFWCVCESGHVVFFTPEEY